MRGALLSLVVGVAVGSSQLFAQQPSIEAVKLDTDARTGELVASGNARMSWQNALLTANEIRYDVRKMVATARGNVTLTRGPQRLLADELTYALDTRSFTLENPRVGQHPFYLWGRSASGNWDQITLVDAVASYTEPHPLAPAVKASKVVYSPNKSVQAEHPRIGLGATVPVSLPQFQQDLDDPFLSYLDAHLGYRASLGAFLGLAAELPVTPGLKAGGELSYYTKRGVLFGPSATYDAQVGSHEVLGRFRSGYIHDTGDRLQDALARPIKKDRGYIEWEHRQAITDRLSLGGQLSYWSDSEIVRDFVPEEFFGVQTPDSFLEGLYTANNYVVSLFGRFQPNDFIRVQERLPELRFDLLPVHIGHGIYQRFSASLAVLREEEIAFYPSVRSERLDAYYSLYRPIAPREWFAFTPVVGGRVTHYTRALNGKSDYTRFLGEVGFDTHLRASGVYEYKNPRWGIDGIRHLVTPRLSYRYIPNIDKGQRYIPAIDRTVFSTYLQPLGLGDQRNVDELHGSNTLRVGLDNTFQTRHESYGSRDLLLFNIAADLRIDREPGQHAWSEIHTEAIFTPAQWLQLDIYQSVSPQTLRIRELNTGIRIIDGDVWSVRLGNRYLKHDIQEYLLDARYRVNELYHPFVRFHYDVRQSRFVEQTVGLRHVINNLWTIDYAVSFYSGRRRESNYSFALRVNVTGF
jgi:LPS-assembly protein